MDPKALIDDLHRMILDEVLAKFGVNTLSEKEISELNRAWHRLDPWPDAVEGLNRLKTGFRISTLSNGNVELLDNMAKRAGLLHDLGKAADHDMDGGHPKIGADILKRNGEGEEVVHAAFGHHDEIIIEHPYTVVVATADACSASRPGARRESLDRYIKRMEELETIAKEFAGVQRAFAVQAGREVRVIANAKDTDDNKAAKICRDIADAFEERLTFPGEIKVTVIRESRFLELAK